MNTILLVDALNLFIRAFASFPSMSLHGQQCGGLVGFLKSLEAVCSDVRPDIVYVVWESGGSAQRRAIYPDYKGRRKPQKLNRYYEPGEIPDTVENHQRQIILTAMVLDRLPVKQVYVDGIEADDVIAYLCRHRHAGDRKVILSSDRDYYQLLDSRTLIYRPGRKMFVSYKNVLAEFGVPVHNFALAKAVVGDVSDNVPGVQGVGFKMLVRLVPDIASDREMTVASLVEACKARAQSHPSAVLTRIIESEATIARNWRLVYLDLGCVSAEHVSKIEASADSSVTSRKMDVMRVLIHEGITGVDVDRLVLSLTTALQNSIGQTNE